MRIAEVDRDPGVDPQAGVLRHLCPLIPGQRPAELGGQCGDRARNSVADRLGTMPSERGPVLHANARAVARQARQVEHEREPVARSTSVPMAELPSPRMRSPSQCPGSSARPVRRHAVSSRRRAPRPCTIQRLVHGLVADAQGIILGEVAREAPGNLLWTPRPDPPLRLPPPLAGAPSTAPQARGPSRRLAR